MRLDESMNAVRLALLVAIGVPTAACGGDVTTPGSGSGGASASNGPSGPSGSNGTVGSGGSGGECKGAVPILSADGVDTGYAKCPDGTVHKPKPATCDTKITAPACQGTETALNCMSDADCIDGKLGRCIHFPSEAAPEPSCNCVYPCANDADCGAGKACVCNGVTPSDGAWSQCAPAGCTADAQCPSGECGVSSFNDGCSTQIVLACRTAADACRLTTECAMNESCSVLDGAWVCQFPGCAIGRPLLVDGAARTARAVSRTDWSACAPRVDVAGLTPAVRAALAARWTEVAALEHASVASFARFTLQLLAVGAPSELLAEAQRAAADEVEHARAAYALASAYAGRAVGPGPLDVTGLDVAVDPRRIVEQLVEEACIGETIGSVEASVLARYATDPVLSELHAGIARDELRHAELAWKTLRWLVESSGGALREVARGAFERALGAPAPAAVAEGPEAPEHGLISAAELGRIRHETLRQVVALAAERALGGALRAEHAAHRAA